MEAKSQVTALRWREETKDIATGHGKGYGLIWDL